MFSKIKKLLVTLTAGSVFLIGCGKRDSYEVPDFQTEYPKVNINFDHIWVLSSQWRGFMGIAIGLSADKYYYWFYSDVYNPDEPIYPLTGQYTFEGGNLHLEGNVGSLYASEWVTKQIQGRLCLWAKRDVDDITRILIPDPRFDSVDPFKHQGLLHAEQ